MNEGGEADIFENLDIDSLVIQLEKELLEEDGTLFDFITIFWEVIVPGDEFISSWYIEYMCEELEVVANWVINREPKKYDLVINVPPGSTKSTICTIMFPLWLWLKDPTVVAITSSYSGALSIIHSTKSRDIARSEKFTLLLSDYFERKFKKKLTLKKDKDGKSNWENNFTGERIATSTGGTVTGRHGHIIIIDDPIKPDETASPKAVAAANNHMNKTLSSRKKNKESTPVILVMQRLHHADPSGNLLSKNKPIKHICLPAEEQDNISPPELRAKYVNGLLDPVRLSQAVLAEAKVDLGSRDYAHQYGQEASPGEGDIFKRVWFPKINYAKFLEILANARKRPETVDVFIDGAYTSNKDDNDPTEMFTSVKIDNKAYILDASQQWLEYNEALRFIEGFVKKGKNMVPETSGKACIENKATGISFKQSLVDDTDVDAINIKCPSVDKETRARKASPKIEAGRVILVGDFWTENFLNMVCDFPNAVHDGLTDCLSMMVDYYFGSNNGLSKDEVNNLLPGWM